MGRHIKHLGKLMVTNANCDLELLLSFSGKAPRGSREGSAARMPRTCVVVTAADQTDNIWANGI